MAKNKRIAVLCGIVDTKWEAMTNVIKQIQAVWVEKNGSEPTIASKSKE